MSLKPFSLQVLKNALSQNIFIVKALTAFLYASTFAVNRSLAVIFNNFN